MKNCYLLLLLPACTIFVSAQNKAALGFKEMSIIQESKKINFSICTSANPTKILDNHKYYYYTKKDGIDYSYGDYSGSLLHGKLQEYSNTGKLLREANYKLGQTTYEKNWDTLGQLIEFTKFKDGIIDYYMALDTNQKTIEIIGKMDAVGCTRIVTKKGVGIIEISKFISTNNIYTKMYHSSNHQLKSIQFYKKTPPSTFILHGTYRLYQENGKLEVSGKYTEGCRDSIWTWYKQNGEPDWSEKYKIYEEFYPNKKIKVRGSYILALNQWTKFGTWYYYTKEGEVEKTEEQEKIK